MKVLKKRFIIIAAALLLLVSGPVAYGYDNAFAGQAPVLIDEAEETQQPAWTAYRHAIGGVEKPGDLFYINALNSPGDIHVNLYITNADELSHYYRYLILEVGIYVSNASGGWERAELLDVPPNGELFLTLKNGGVSFTIAGAADYKLGVDDGSFYCIASKDYAGDASPQFYLETTQVGEA